MDEIHLDPACNFVAFKSAETDGIDSEVALLHFGECRHCQEYHAGYVKKFGLLEEGKAKHLFQLEEERKAKEAQTERNMRLARARMALVLAHFPEGKETVRNEYPGLHNSWVCWVRLKMEDCEFSMETRSDSDGTILGVPGDSCTELCQPVSKLVDKVAKHLAGAEQRKRRKA